MVLNKFIGTFGTLKNLTPVFAKIPFLVVGIFLMFFLYLDSAAYTSVSEQALQIQNSVMFLGLFCLFALFIANLFARERLIKEFLEMTGWRAFFGCFLTFFISGIIFTSMRGNVDPMFMQGLFADHLFTFVYNGIVALFEETIFRVALFVYLGSLTANRFIIYSVIGAVFAFFHIPVYVGVFPLIMAFCIGCVFAMIMDLDNIGGFPTFPIVFALHWAYNLAQVGALAILGF